MNVSRSAAPAIGVVVALLGGTAAFLVAWLMVPELAPAPAPTPVTAPATTPAAESTAGPAAGPAPKSTAESAPVPSAEPVVDPVAESIAGPAAAPVPEIIESPWEVPLVTGVAVLTGLLACAVPLVVLRRTARPASVLEVAPAAPPPPPDPRLIQREKAIRGLADLVGQLPPEFAWQAVNVLEAAGARQIVADGRPFDPDLHRAVGTEATLEASLHDTVARTVRPGWADRDRVVAPARVVVFVAAAHPGVLP